MRTALFLAFLLAALGFADMAGRRSRARHGRNRAGDGRRGRAPAPIYLPVEVCNARRRAILRSTSLASSATTVLALCAHRFWPMIAAVLHFLPLLAHTSRMLDMTLHPAAYLTMQVAASWLVPPLLHPRNLASSAALAAEGQRSVLARLVGCVEPDNSEIIAARLIAEFRSLARLLSQSPDAIARVVGQGSPVVPLAARVARRHARGHARRAA